MTTQSAVVLLNGVTTVSDLVPELSAALAVAVVGWFGSFFFQRRRIAWRRQLDAKVGVAPHHPQSIKLKVSLGDQEVPDASLVLLRIRNAGIIDVDDRDFRKPLYFVFPGREVVDFEFPQTDPEALRDLLQPCGLEQLGPTIHGDSRNELHLPAFPLNRSERFTMLVLLRGSGTEIEARGFIHGGRIVRDPRRRGPRTSNIAIGSIIVLILGVLLGVAVGGRATVSPSALCVAGNVHLQGSTAFAPVADRIADAFNASCSVGHVTVDAETAEGTFNGLQELENAGGQSSPDAALTVAMSDGIVSPTDFPDLIPHEVGGVVYTLVVGNDVFTGEGITNLTKDQVRGIFNGSITDWRQIAGPNGPSLPVHIVGRSAQSGTRQTFEQQVLGFPEPGNSSHDCVHRNGGAQTSPVILCEQDSTQRLLEEVAITPGAIGYAETSVIATFRPTVGQSAVRAITLDGFAATVPDVRAGTYPFWTVEYFYTYGTPDGSSLTAAFLAYMNSPATREILDLNGFPSCLTDNQAAGHALCTAANAATANRPG